MITTATGHARPCLRGVIRPGLIVACVLAATSAARAVPEPSEEELIGVITIQPRARHAEAYAEALLDKLRREGRSEELRAWVDRMLAMPRLLDGREALIVLLQNQQVQMRFLDARILLRQARRNQSVEGLRAAGALLEETARLSRMWAVSVTVRDGFHVTSIADEATALAAMAFDDAGDIGQALRLLGEITTASFVELAGQRMVSLAVRAPVVLHARAFAWLAR